MYHIAPASATSKSKKLSRRNPGTPIDFSARCAIVAPVESVSDTDRANTLTGTDRTMTDITKAIEAIEGVTIVEPLIVIDADGNETEDAIYQVDSPEALKALFEAFESAT